jgi:hypothetical protein
MKIKLDPMEMYHGGLVGYRRNLESIIRKRKPRFPESVTGELFGYHILGAMAELVVAKALHVYWGFHVNKFSSCDVKDYEVRYSQRKDLKVRERDDGIIIAVTGYPPDFEIVGWINAGEAKRPDYSKQFRDGPPAYFVPHEQLRDINDLEATD